MKNGTRARVAAVVAAAAQRNRVSSIFDYSSSSYRLATVSIDSGRVSGFDYSSSSHFSGSNASNDAFDFFDYETSSHVSLKVEGSSFSGFDYHTSSHFSGRVNGRSVSLYDYGTSSYYNFAA